MKKEYYRHAEKQKKYVVKCNALAGYGIYAAKYIAQGEIIFASEEKPHRLVTKKYVEQNWSDEEQRKFQKICMASK